MDMERIDENTVKFFITNQDMEARGFAIDEVRRDRERSEELIWEMLDEVQEDIDLELDGILRVQVNISDAGMEFILNHESLITRLEQLGKMFEGTSQKTRLGGLGIFPRLSRLTQPMNTDTDKANPEDKVTNNCFFAFTDFEDLIGLYKNAFMRQLPCEVYHYQGVYYLFVDLVHTDLNVTDAKRLIARIAEFGIEPEVTAAVVREYGKVVIEGNVFQTINEHFNDEYGE